jgi:hypothetical protein
MMRRIVPPTMFFFLRKSSIEAGIPMRASDLWDETQEEEFKCSEAQQTDFDAPSD